MAILRNIFLQCRANNENFCLPPPPPSSSHNNKYSIAEWNELCKAGLTAGFVLFASFTAVFVFGPPKDKDLGWLYAAYLLVVYMGIVISILTSLYFFNSLATSVLNWKIKAFFTFLGTFLLLSCTIRFNLELHSRYTIYVWFSFIVLVIIIWGCWFDYHRLIQAAPVSDKPSTTTTPTAKQPPPLPATGLKEPL